jgi:hypothetical protein
MKRIIVSTLVALGALSAMTSTGAFAQEKTRAEVRQELIEAQQNGSQYVTDTSYPNVNPIYTHQVEQMQARALAKADASSAMASASTASTNPYAVSR